VSDNEDDEEDNEEDRVSKASFVSGREIYISRSEIVDKLYDK
jgi:hypothetical protein